MLIFFSQRKNKNSFLLNLDLCGQLPRNALYLKGKLNSFVRKVLKEKGEEFLTEVRIEEDTMNLTSNNGANQEIWERIQS